MPKKRTDFRPSIVLAFSRIKKLFDDADGLHPELKKEAGQFLEAMLRPENQYDRDLESGLRFLRHVLESSRWKFSEFFQVMEAHRYLSEVLRVTEKESV